MCALVPPEPDPGSSDPDGSVSITPGPDPSQGPPDGGPPAPPDAQAVDSCGRSGGLVIEPCTLPPPCAGLPYELPLRLAGGGEGRTWQLAASSGDQLDIDPDTGLLSGVVTEAFTLEVSVSDRISEGRAQYRVDPRSSCWFAYASTENGSRRVHLVDPLLLDSAPRHDLPRDMPAGANVEDFRFSPDGRWLAVRVDDGGTRSVELFTAPSWESAGVLDAAGSVADYAWSPNGQVLAVAAGPADARTLGGVRVLREPELGNASVVALTPVATPADPPLVWVGDGSVAFHAQDASDPFTHYLYSGLLADAGAQFTSVAAYTDFPYEIGDGVTLTLVPGTTTFVVVANDGTNRTLSSFAATAEGGPARVSWFPDDTVVSQSGELLARSRDGALEVFSAREYTLMEPVPVATAPGCDRVLAWSADDAQLACAAAGSSRGTLRVFTLADGRLTGALVEGDYDFPVDLQFRRRAFAPGRRWFTFGTAYGLHSVSLGSEPLQQRGAGTRVDSVTSATEIALSPDGEQVVVHTGRWLTLLPLSDLDFAQNVTEDELDDAEPCVENDAWASNSACNTTRTRSSQTVWSPDSRVFAFRTKENELLLHQTGNDATARSLSIACDGTCITSSDFQPFSFE